MPRKNRPGQGRRPTPTALKVARGTDGRNKQRQNRSEPAAPSSRPACPKYLDPVARKEWKRICDYLKSLGVLSSVYAPALEQYCIAYSFFRAMLSKVNKEGVIIEDVDGNAKRNPAVIEMHKYKDACFKWLTEFGLTPSAKTRLIPEADAKVPSAFEQFISGKRA